MGSYSSNQIGNTEVWTLGLDNVTLGVQEVRLWATDPAQPPASWERQAQRGSAASSFLLSFTHTSRDRGLEGIAPGWSGSLP